MWKSEVVWVEERRTTSQGNKLPTRGSDYYGYVIISMTVHMQSSSPDECFGGIVFPGCPASKPSSGP